MKILTRALILAFLAVTARAGQSLVTTTNAAQNTSFPNHGHANSVRIEFYIHDWSSDVAWYLLHGDAIGINVAWYNGGGNDQRLMICSTWDTSTCGSQLGLPLSGLAVKATYVRLQLDQTARVLEMEAWDKDGVRFYAQTQNLGSDAVNAGTGIQWGSNGGGTWDTGFFRVHSTLVPMNSRCPVTSDNTNTLLHWKFDGNLTDSSGNGYTATMTSGSPTYVSTPYQNVIAVVKTANAPTWTNWVSLRAGKPSQLNGASSYSQGDASAAVTYAWSEISGPTGAPPVTWDDATLGNPTVQGLIFGTYNFGLTVTDAAGTQATSTLTVGAVATDDNGVVVNANPAADAIFGPMIAYGQNPWGYMDERAMKATVLRSAVYTASGLNPAPWQTAQAGTVSYTFSGRGYLTGLGTALCSPITSATQLSITVCDATKLDLTSLPTRILIGASYVAQEEIRICSAAGNVLTVCYDGRGNSTGTYTVPATTWSNSSPVGQMKVAGTGTAFKSSLCLANGGVAPFAAGTIFYNTGTVTVTPGSANIVGVGTSWPTEYGGSDYNGRPIRIQATHGGTAFSFIAWVTAINSATSITISRPFPADADSGTYPYQIVNTSRVPSLHYTRADSSDAQILWNSNGCESDTALYLTSSHDITSLNGTTQIGKQYSYAETPWYVNAYGVNFYGEDLAHRALYYRSGWKPALDAANVISDQWITSPYVAGGDAGGNPLLLGGGVIGAIAAAAIDNRVDWSNIRATIAGAVGTLNAYGFSSGSPVCNNDDTRDWSYEFAWIALGAQFDPDTSAGGYRSKWQTALSNVYTWEVACKRSDNSWANSGYKWSPGQAVNVTNGSTAVTGTGFTPANCYGVASGSITVTHGSAVATGSGFVAGNKIIISGTSGGSPFTGFYRYQYNSAGSVTLGVLWPGDSGTFPYLIENNDASTTIGVSGEDPQIRKSWGCTYNSSTSLTLNRPWDGPTETAQISQGGIPGYSQQPYMMGIKTTELRWASQVAAVNPTGFATLRDLAAAWVQSTGYDPVTQGMYYGRVMQMCESSAGVAPPSSPLFDTRTPWCSNGLASEYIAEARQLTAEGNSTISVYYAANPTTAAETWGDTIYGSLWGYGPYTASGFYFDSYQGSNLADGNLGSYKWTGFNFGMGMAHQWPAARLGGVQAAVPAVASVTFSLAGHAGAVSARVTVTAPSSATVNYVCANSPCPVTLDKRQGTHWVRVAYLDGSGTVLATDTPVMMEPGGAAQAPWSVTLNGLQAGGKFVVH